MAHSRTKLALALSDEELEQFLAELRTIQGLTGSKLRELAEKNGITIGHNAANEFLNQEFRPYCDRLAKARNLALFITQHKDGETPSSTVADSAAEQLSQMVFEFLMSSSLDLSDPKALAKVDQLALVIARLRQGNARRDEVVLKYRRAAQETKKAVDATLKAATGEITEETRTAILDLIDEKMGLK